MDDWTITNWMRTALVWLRRTFGVLRTTVTGLIPQSPPARLEDVIDLIVDAIWRERVTAAPHLLIPERVEVFLEARSLAFWKSRTLTLEESVKAGVIRAAQNAARRDGLQALMPEHIELMLMAAPNGGNRAQASFAEDPVNVAPMTLLPKPAARRTADVPTVPYTPDFVIEGAQRGPKVVLQHGTAAARSVPAALGLRVGRTYGSDLEIPSTPALTLAVSRQAMYVQRVDADGVEFHITNAAGATLHEPDGRRRKLLQRTSITLHPGQRLLLADEPQVAVWVEAAGR